MVPRAADPKLAFYGRQRMRWVIRFVPKSRHEHVEGSVPFRRIREPKMEEARLMNGLPGSWTAPNQEGLWNGMLWMQATSGDKHMVPMPESSVMGILASYFYSDSGLEKPLLAPSAVESAMCGRCLNFMATMHKV